MKILISLLALVLAFSITAQAQTTDTKQQSPQQPAQGDQQMQMGCRMMGGSGMGGGGMMGGKMGCMMNHGAMMHDILDVVTGMLKMQQKIIEGVTPAEREALLKEIARLQGKVEEMQKTAHRMPMMMHHMPMDHSSPQPETKQDTPGAPKETPKPQMQHQH